MPRAGLRRLGRRRGRPPRQPARARAGRADRARLARRRAPRPAGRGPAGTAARRQRHRHGRRLRLPSRRRRHGLRRALGRLPLGACGWRCAASPAASASSCRAPRATCCRAARSVDDEAEATRIGERLACEALHALADRPAWPRRLVQRTDGSLIPMLLFRWEDGPAGADAARGRRAAARLPPAAAAVGRGDGGRPRATRRSSPRPSPAAPVRPSAMASAITPSGRGARPRRVAAGTAPTELEAGARHSHRGRRDRDGARRDLHRDRPRREGALARRPTLYAGYTNGAVGYFPTAAAYDEGGYEPAYSNRSYGAPAPVAPGCAQLLVQEGVRLARVAVPGAAALGGRRWEPSGRVPDLPAPRGSSAPRPGSTRRRRRSGRRASVRRCNWSKW